MSKGTDIVERCEECDLLGEEVARLTGELEKREEKQQKPKGGPIKRLLARLFGPLVYDGPENCGHCKYWKRPENLETSDGRRLFYGDCKLLIGRHDTTYKEKCHRFTPRWRYFRRVKTWRSEA